MSGDGECGIKFGQKNITIVLNWWKMLSIAAGVFIPTVTAAHFVFWLFADAHNDFRYAIKSDVVTMTALSDLRREANEKFVSNKQFTEYQDSVKDSLIEMKSDISDTRGDVKEILRYMRDNKKL